MTNEKPVRSFRTTVLLLLGTIMAVFILILYLVLQTAVSGILRTTEEDALLDRLNIAVSMLENANIATTQEAENIAYWHETVLYAKHENDNFVAKNWQILSPRKNQKIDFLLIKDSAGINLISEYYAHDRQTTLNFTYGFDSYVRQAAQDALANAREQSAVRNRSAMLSRSGIVFFDGEPYYLTIAPITTRGVDSAVHGTVIIGNVLNARYFQQLTQLDEYTFGMEPALGETPGETLISIAEHDTITASRILLDYDNAPVRLWLSAPRTAYLAGQQQLLITGGLFVLIAALFMFLMYWVSTRQVVMPIEKLSRDIQAQERPELLDATQYANNSEFYILCHAINEMVTRLNESRMSLNVFDHILNGMNTYLYVSDPTTGEVIFINDKMREHFHVDEDCIGKPCWNLLQNELTDRCKFCPLPELLENPDHTVIWEEYNSRTGRYYRNNDSLINWMGDRKVHLHHRMDITDIKEAENALTQRLEQQQIMAKISHEFITEHSPDAFILNALQASGIFTGASRTLITKLNPESGKTELAYEWVNPEGTLDSIADRFVPYGQGNPIYDALVIHGEPYAAFDDISDVSAFSHVHLDGIRSSLSMPILIDDRVWGIMSIAVAGQTHPWSESDIHLFSFIASVIAGVLDRQASDEMIARMSSIAESSPEYIAYVNKEGAFEYFNQGVLNITGYSAQELEKGGLGILFSAETTTHILDDLFPQIHNKGLGSFELPLFTKDGRERIMSFSTFTIDSHPDDIGAIGSDITEKRQMERDLVVAKEEAERSNLAKSEFLSRMSHEMRTPMNAIIGMTNIAQSTDDQEKKDYCLDKIDEASNHLLGVINDILDMSKIEANKFELSYAELNVERMLQRIVNIVNFRVDEKDQDLLIHIDPAVPQTIVSDEQRLSQIITNLLSNATKFTPEKGTIRLNLRKLGEENGETTLEISVSDTGIGVSAEQQARLFQSFEQADGSISRKYGGTGLGLAISKRIVNLMGGNIWVESVPGEGATFTFTIQTTAGEENGRSEGHIAGVDLSKIRVLAVDDAPDIREYFLMLSDRFGFFCDVASSGYEAYRMVTEAEEPYSIAFIDWKMPEMDGVELARRIKDSSNAPKTIIMISAAEWNDVENEAVSAGVDKFVPKPLFASKVMDCIHEAFSVPGFTSNSPDKKSNIIPDGSYANRHILLAEDIEINREIVLALLEKTGLVVDSAENGQEALDKFAQSPDRYDVIFMDIHMPEMDGYEATRRIRALNTPRATIIPIVAMTANVFREDIERCLAAGMNDHIGKPIDVDEFYEKLNQYLGRRAHE